MAQRELKVPEQLDLGPLVSLLKDRSIFIALVTLACATIALGSTFFISRRYKSEAQVTIYTRYFQNPLVNELIPDQYDTTELRLQRESLLHQALDDSFIDSLGEREHFYSESGSNPKNARGRIYEQDLIKKSFEIFAINGTTFEVNAIGNDPIQAQSMNKAAIDQIGRTLVSQRRKMLMTARDAIRSRLDTIAFQNGKGVDPVASNNPEVLKRELSKLEEETQSLLRHFTPQHEEVRKRTARIQWIKNYLGAAADDAAAPDSKNSLLGAESEAPSKEVYQELLKKLNYLNVAIDMEKTDLGTYFGVIEQPSMPMGAFSPKRFKFLGFGIMVGLLLGLFYVMLQEYMKAVAPSAIKRAEAYGAPFLGTLPELRWPAAQSIVVQTKDKPDATEWN